MASEYFRLKHPESGEKIVATLKAIEANRYWGWHILDEEGVSVGTTSPYSFPINMTGSPSLSHKETT